MQVNTFRTDGEGRLHRVIEQCKDLRPNEARIRVAAVSLNFRDIPFIRGREGRPAGRNRIPCSDAVGRVEAVGKDVTRVAVGDRVSPTILPYWLDGPLHRGAFRDSFGTHDRDGVLADVIVVEESALVKVPEYLSDDEAATLPGAAITAWHTIHELGVLGNDEVVVVETTGGVAIFAVQFAKAIGARVVVTSRSDEKLARAKEVGAWEVINSQQTPSWDETVLKLTNGIGAQLVVDMGLKNGLPRSCRAAAYEGTVAIVGVVDGWKADFDIAPVMNKNLRIRGVETGSRTMFERMNRFLEKHRIRPVIDSVFQFEQTEEALKALAASPFGKIVIRVD